MARSVPKVSFSGAVRPLLAPERYSRNLHSELCILKKTGSIALLPS